MKKLILFGIFGLVLVGCSKETVTNSDIKSTAKLFCEKVSYDNVTGTTYRCENKEVVCYMKNKAMSCKFKGE